MQDETRDPRMEVIATVYRLHGALRSAFAGPTAATRLVLLEALALGTIVTDETPPTVSGIGRTLGFSRQSVQRAVNKLVILGLARPEPNPRHKKAPVFVATEAGVERMRMVQAKSKELAAKLVDPFGDTRSVKLLGELNVLLAAIKRHSGAGDD